MTLSRTLALAASVASGVLLWVASPAVGAGPLAWVALLPAAVVALARPETRLGRAALPLAYVVFLELLLVPALPFGIARDQWGEPPVPILVGDSPVVVVALVVVPLAGLALYAVRFPQPLMGERRALVLVLVPAVVWTALDVARAKLDPGGFWGPLFLSQAETEARGVAAFAGPWLVTFALVALNVALALALLRRDPLPAALAVLAAGALVAFPRPDADGERLRVAAIQPGYDTAEFDLAVNHYLRRAFRDLERASLDLARDLAPLTRAAAERGAEIAVWPEATVWVHPAENARVRRDLTDLAAETGVVLVVPYFLRGPDHGAAVAFLPDGTVTRPQPKQRPMWFLGERGGNRTDPEPVDAGTARVGTLLGVDTQEPGTARTLATAGATLLASSTHDWAALAEPQIALARLHAVALARPIVRADWRYGSAIVGADGDVLATAGPEKRQVALVADVETPTATTPYTRVGDVLGWLCLVALAPIGLVAYLRRLRRERADAQGAAQPLGETELPAHPPA